MRHYSFLLAALAVLLLSGCPRPPAVQPEPPAATEVPERDSGVTTGTVAEPMQPALDPFEDPANPLSRRVIYFDFDQSTIRPEFVDIVNAHGRYLARNKGDTVRLEGHADERGSREYNIGLGERRAQAVRRMLKLQGVGDSQITTISYGEERPADEGHNEAAWAKNRRVVIVYR
ncbi:MAG: peptidoglycan-associated lipoprotein Pal [Gammaproteobacteria bacterium]|nr:peptidoglycan-associated lipoprotein Pal [Gammaproteobacteria bacterium]